MNLMVRISYFGNLFFLMTGWITGSCGGAIWEGWVIVMIDYYLLFACALVPFWVPFA